MEVELKWKSAERICKARYVVWRDALVAQAKAQCATKIALDDYESAVKVYDHCLKALKWGGGQHGCKNYDAESKDRG